MAEPASYTIACTSDGKRISATETFSTTDNVQKLSVEVANGQTDYEILIGIDISKLKLFMLKTDVAATIETNSGSTPDDTFTLAAGGLVFYKDGDTLANTFTADVSALYVTNSSGSTATIEVFVATDA